MAEWELPKLHTAVRFRSPAFLLLMSLFVLVFEAGCTQYVGPPGSSVVSRPAAGLTHQVVRGETLWRIARDYGVEVEELAKANRISNISLIEEGQVLVIPPHSLSPAPAGAGEEFIWPAEGKVISIFGMRRGPLLNKGIDISTSWAAPIVASRSGLVSFVHQNLPGYGKIIIVDHQDGYATVYAYLHEVLVSPGQRVSQRQVIARAGQTGRAEVTTLHFEIRLKQKPRNPFYYLSS